MAAGNPLNEALKQEILSVDGITDLIVKRQAVHATLTTDIDSLGSMCDMITEENSTELEEAIVSGILPADSHSILVANAHRKGSENLTVGTTVNISFGEKSMPVIISGFYDTGEIPSGHGTLGLDGAMLYAPEAV